MDPRGGELEAGAPEAEPWTRRRGRAARRSPGPRERGTRGEVPRGSGRRGLPVLRAGGGSVELERSLPARPRRGGEARRREQEQGGEAAAAGEAATCLALLETTIFAWAL